jgi:hypothetical protein
MFPHAQGAVIPTTGPGGWARPSSGTFPTSAASPSRTASRAGGTPEASPAWPTRPQNNWNVSAPKNERRRNEGDKRKKTASTKPNSDARASFRSCPCAVPSARHRPHHCAEPQNPAQSAPSTTRAASSLARMNPRRSSLKPRIATHPGSQSPRWTWTPAPSWTTLSRTGPQKPPAGITKRNSRPLTGRWRLRAGLSGSPPKTALCSSGRKPVPPAALFQMLLATGKAGSETGSTTNAPMLR